MHRKSISAPSFPPTPSPFLLSLLLRQSHFSPPLLFLSLNPSAPLLLLRSKLFPHHRRWTWRSGEAPSVKNPLPQPPQPSFPLSLAFYSILFGFSHWHPQKEGFTSYRNVSEA